MHMYLSFIHYLSDNIYSHLYLTMGFITIKSAGEAVCCSSSFLLLSFSRIWDVHRLAFLNLCSTTEESICREIS